MRRFVRNQILDLLSTIWEGVKQSKTLNPQSAESVLTDCYLAVQTVEQTLQNGLSQEAFSKYVDLLLEIKDRLEQINAGISQGVSVSDFKKKLKSELKLLSKTLTEEKEFKLEVVFFPYKASMWDSLESIWLAVRDDENCDAYVVPIPYYDKLPNGEFGEMRYEGDLYPEYVPVVDWQLYDLESRRPDVIYIHNPYDNNNRVTSVHPDFYSKRLREFTDMLVYVPYFIVASDVPEHFCTTEGCVYAHKTVVQSEQVYNTSVRVFKEAFGSRFGKPETKFVSIGSPKIDKVINTKRENCPLPPSWENLLKGKKAVLYNTSIGEMLRDSERYLDKIKDVCSVFQKRQDVVLWWRPHPLMESTLKSMRPALADVYIKLTEKYRQESYGIFDNTQDLYRAVTWCDAYYGDPSSSLLALWYATGKALLAQNIHTYPLLEGRQIMPITETAFTALVGWADYLENNMLFPEINLNNFLNALAADKLPPIPREVFTKKASLPYSMPQNGAGSAIHQYIKQQVIPT